MNFQLTELEQITLQHWLNSRAVKKFTGGYYNLAITYQPTGIGTKIVAIVRAQSTGATLEKDISDYGSW